MTPPSPAAEPTPTQPVRTLPGRAALDSEEGERAGVTTRIVLAATAVFGQLWALSAALDRYLLGHEEQAWILFGFSALSFLVVLAVTLIRPAPRRDVRGHGRASTQIATLYHPDPVDPRSPERAVVASSRPAGAPARDENGSTGWPRTP